MNPHSNLYTRYNRSKINELSWWSGNALEAKYLATGMKGMPFCTVYMALLKERKMS